MANRRPILLSKDLEHAIMAAIIKGQVAPATVAPGEVSREGKVVLKAVTDLVDGGTAPPYSLKTIMLTATDVMGQPKEAMGAYLRGIAATTTTEDISEILQKVRDKQTLIALVNTAADQLQSGVLDVVGLSTLLQQRESSPSGGLLSVSELLKDGIPEPPVGIALRSLPTLQGATGGIYGLWVIGGEAKVGKSTLAWQIALDVSNTGLPVLYYDPENGFPVMMNHTKEIFAGDLERIRSVTTNLYYRDNIRTLDSDLSSVVPPALVIVDNIQKLPTNIEYKRAGLDKWLSRFEALKKRGYTVLLVSELNRAHYNAPPSMGGFKETGEIEYSADLGIQLVRASEDSCELHIVANRHRPFTGFLGHLRRERSWVWKEESARAVHQID